MSIEFVNELREQATSWLRVASHDSRMKWFHRRGLAWTIQFDAKRKLLGSSPIQGFTPEHVGHWEKIDRRFMLTAVAANQSLSNADHHCTPPWPVACCQNA